MEKAAAGLYGSVSTSASAPNLPPSLPFGRFVRHQETIHLVRIVGKPYKCRLISDTAMLEEKRVVQFLPSASCRSSSERSPSISTVPELISC